MQEKINFTQYKIASFFLHGRQNYLFPENYTCFSEHFMKKYLPGSKQFFMQNLKIEFRPRLYHIQIFTKIIRR